MPNEGNRIMIVIGIIFLCAFASLFILVVCALLRYIRSKEVRQEKTAVQKSLGER